MKVFKEIERVASRQGDRIREVIVPREPGAPEGSERIMLQNFGECTVHSCQPAGRENFRIVVRRA